MFLYHFRFLLDSFGFLFIQYLTPPFDRIPNIADFEYTSRVTNGENPAI